MTPTNFKRWQKHLDKWPIAYLKGDDELGSHSENPKLIAWLDSQLSHLAAVGLTKSKCKRSWWITKTIRASIANWHCVGRVFLHGKNAQREQSSRFPNHDKSSHGLRE